MIKRLAASIREYKRDTILTPLLMIGEVVCECVIPLYTAQLVNSIQAGCTRDVIFYYGLRLLGLALLSLCFGMAAGWFCAAASTGFAKTCGTTCSTACRTSRSPTSTSSPRPRSSRA